VLQSLTFAIKKTRRRRKVKLLSKSKFSIVK
jgi:hypothetical protein